MSIPEHVVAQWHKQAMSGTDEQGFGPNSCWGKFATQAARWGADQELEACVEWCADESIVLAQELQEARRPKPPSLAEGALEALEDGDIGPAASLTPVEVCIIRRALERLKELEQQENNDN